MSAAQSTPQRPAGQRRRRSGRPSGAPATAPTTAPAQAPEARPVDVARENVTFAELGLPEPLVAALLAQGKTAPFAIQTLTIPDSLAGRDVLGRAQTGSGKTLAFGLPMLAKLAGAKSAPRSPRGLVLVPTRELASQVTAALEPLAAALGLRVGTVVAASRWVGRSSSSRGASTCWSPRLVGWPTMCSSAPRRWVRS